MARYEYTRIKDHPLNPGRDIYNLPKHRVVLYDKIGPGPHPCHTCGKLVNWMSTGKTSAGALVVDHLDNDSRNNDPKNLEPSCHPCNCRRDHPQTIKEGEKWAYMTGSPIRHRADERICKHCGSAFLFIDADKRPDRGQFCSKHCMYKRNKDHYGVPGCGQAPRNEN